jgi:hypothetical protein
MPQRGSMGRHCARNTYCHPHPLTASGDRRCRACGKDTAPEPAAKSFWCSAPAPRRWPRSAVITPRRSMVTRSLAPLPSRTTISQRENSASLNRQAQAVHDAHTRTVTKTADRRVYAAEVAQDRCDSVTREHQGQSHRRPPTTDAVEPGQLCRVRPCREKAAHCPLILRCRSNVALDWQMGEKYSNF